MAPHQDYYHIQYYHRDPLRSIQLGHVYITSPDCLVKAWICTILLHPDQIVSPGLNTYRLPNFILTWYHIL